MQLASAVYEPFAFRLAAQYFFIRRLTALRAATDILRLRRRFRTGCPELFATMSEMGSSFLSNESGRCGKNSMSIWAS